MTAGPGNPILACRVSAKFAFIELRTVEETNACLNITGIPFMGAMLKVGRPTKYTGPQVGSGLKKKKSGGGEGSRERKKREQSKKVGK